MTAGLKTDSDGRRFFKQRLVRFQTIQISAKDIHGIWLRHTSPLQTLDWNKHPEPKEIRAFALSSSERLIDFWYQVLDVALARALAHRDIEILRTRIFKSDSLFDIGIPTEQDHSSVPTGLREAILRQYQSSITSQTDFNIYYLSEYLNSINLDLTDRLKKYEELWNVRRDRKQNMVGMQEWLSTKLETETDQKKRGEILKEFTNAESAIFHGSRIHRLKLRLISLGRLRKIDPEKFSNTRGMPAIVDTLARSKTELDRRMSALADSRSVVDRFFQLQNQLEDIYANRIDPFEERSEVKSACLEILKRLRPLRRAAADYSLIPGEKHGAMSLNPVLRLWKEKPNPPRPERTILGLELNTKQTLECLIRLVVLADPDFSKREVLRGKIVKQIRGSESLQNLKLFLIPGSCYPLREIHPLDFPEFRARVIGESRSPTELGSLDKCVLTGSWYSKRQHCLYATVGSDNGRLLKIVWNAERSPGPPAFFFAIGQFVYDCLDDSLVYRREAGRTFRECVEDYYAFEDRIRKNRGEKTGRRKADNSRPAIRFMFAVLYSRFITEILTGSYQSQFRHPMTEKWMEENLNLSREKKHLQRVRLEARSIISSYDSIVL